MRGAFSLSRSQWALFGVAASAAFMAMGSGEEQAAARHAKGRVQQVSMAPLHPDTLKPVAAEGRVELERMLQQQQRQAGSEKKVENVFNATSWYVPPPPPPPPPRQNLPPPQPTAPPLPFTYFGEYKDAGAATKVFFLSNADRVYTVSEGDVIDGIYSVGAVNAGQLEIIYLPLNIKQSLNTGGAL